MVLWKLSIFVALAALAVTQGNWSFKRPEDWVNDYPDCGENQQSPIAINLGEAPKLTQEDLKNQDISYVLENFGTLVDGIIRNTGHAVLIEITSSRNVTSPQLIIINSKGVTIYMLTRIFFHWKSPHPIDGKRYALEMHMEHKDSNNNGLLLTYIFDICSDTPQGMQTVEESLDKLVDSGSSDLNFPQFRPTDLLPKSVAEDISNEGNHILCNFVMYEGSMLMPPCMKGVLFIVTVDISCVPNSQMELFKNIKDINGDPMEGYRPPQPLDGREVVHVTC